MKGKQKIVLRVIFVSFIPVLLNYLAKSENCLDDLQKSGFIGQNINIRLWKDIFLLISALFTTIFLSIKLACLEANQKIIANQRESLIKYNKEIFFKALGNKLMTTDKNINVRIFVQKKGILLHVKKILAKITNGYIQYKEIFTIRNIEGLADTGITKNLSFEVCPEPQGLVGQCYKLRTIIFEDNFKRNCINYNITEYQKNKLNDIEFWLCAPIFNEKGEIISIVSFDSAQKVNISKANKSVWIDMVTNYCQFLYEYLPELFG
ncbi:hypothetical protein [Clostridium thermosuccinogenes]|uniref:hypothetical protein n=1 Tax=Clostridium thermosuccinogenes TaxID=84032 RepID=UPI00105701E7|nr:hypothetical protein [Pseudoclostridium thermosuccinogenes]